MTESADIAKITTKLEIFADTSIKRMQVTCPNGRGVSIIRGYGTYGATAGLFEVAVLDFDGNLDYSTPITDDVLGWQSPEDVRAVVAAVAALPGREIEAPAGRGAIEG
jgi:hypothetical protein